MWQDLEIDIPKFWLYIAETVAPVIEEEAIPISALREVCQPLVEANKAATLFGEILHVAARKLVRNKPYFCKTFVMACFYL